jgi:histone deacetylase 6
MSRPISALRDLRGSRPNSAAIAAQIEGFDTDFQVRCQQQKQCGEVSLLWQSTISN